MKKVSIIKVNSYKKRFGIQSVKRVLSWLKTKNCKKNSSIIDIGCGNGVTCCMLVYKFDLFNY